ncbi:MAG: hypothetical protein QW350_01690 [Candidatus Aenigmatarchaeota archaeon]|nr:hypothetical protein [Candidatus Aenigmarchaeota archaeon]
MKSFYKITVKPKKEFNIKIDDNFKRKIIKNKPWFLILNKNTLFEDHINFNDKKAGSTATITSKGIIEYKELIFLKKEVDIVRTIAVIVGMLKLTKIVYLEDKIPFNFSFEMINVKNREILRSESLSIYGELKVKNDVSVNKDGDFSNINPYEFVNLLMVDILKQIDCPIDESILKKEVKNSIDVLDNPLMFTIKTNLQ